MSWHRALTLAERGRPGRSAGDAAAKKMARWKASFADENELGEWLDAARITMDDLEALFAEPEPELAARVPAPAFGAAIEKAVLAPIGAHIAARFDAMLLREPQFGFASGCARLARPLLCAALEHIDATAASLARSHPGACFDATIADHLVAQCPALLAPLFERTLAAELTAARLEGRLSGDSPEARFEEFIAATSSGDCLLQFYAEYPVLARLVHERISDFAEAVIELLTRLAEDTGEIRDYLPGCSAPLCAVALGAGDVHRRGRSVCVLTFGSAKLVYKPRSVAVEARFQSLLTWLNERTRGKVPELRTIRVLARDGYGYVEHVEHRHATTDVEVKRFYIRQGAYLALFYALDATDLHAENLIASGEDPMPVDLETLFQVRLPAVAPGGFVDPAAFAMEHSVLRTSLLPERTIHTGGGIGADISGIGHAAGASAALPLPRPSLVDHVEEVCSGFRALYEVLLDERRALLERISAFRDDEIRVIVADTRSYHDLLRAATHPQHLRDALERERIYERTRAKLRVHPTLRPLLSSERADLERGNIPYFSIRAGSRTIRDSRGESFDGVLERSGIEATFAHVESLSLRDLATQEWFIRASFAAVPLGEGHVRSRSSRLLPAEQPATTGQLVGAARAIGDRIARAAHQSGELVSWLGLSLVREREWRLAPLDVDLYDGLSGICLFLAYLGAISGDATHTALARGALATLLARARSTATSPAGLVGGYAELVSPIYLLAHLSRLWNEPSLAVTAHAMVEKLGAAIDADEELDFINGSAGCAAALLALHAVEPSPEVLAMARRAADRLVARAQPLGDGRIAWPSPRPALAPLTGLSHGAAGIALALLRVAAAVEKAGDGAGAYRDIARGAFAYERSVFSEAHRNWPDLRIEPGGERSGERFSVAWCHGAPGVGLTRIAARRSIPGDTLLERELDAALATTRAEGFGANHSLCHGDLGNLELLLVAAGDEPTDEVRALAAGILASFAAQGPLCGTPFGVEVPSLMTGLAGIGYGFLRVAAPDRVPSVLTLEPPLAGVPAVSE